MTTRTDPNLEQIKQNMKKYFTEQIVITQTKQTDFKVRMENSKDDQVVSIKNFYALASIVHSQHADTLSMLAGLSEETIDFNIEAEHKLAKLEQNIQEVNETTGTDLSKIKIVLEELRSTIDKPKNEAVARFIALMEKTSENSANKKQDSDNYIK